MSPIYFAQIREDSRIERRIAKERAIRRPVVVASGGCTALSLLTDDCEQVMAVDANPAQMAVVALRIAALMQLERDEHLKFIGEIDASPAERLAWFAKVSPSLSPVVRAFWQANEQAIVSGFNGCGVTEAFYREVGNVLRNSWIGDKGWNALLSTDNLDEQVALADQLFPRQRWRALLCDILSKTAHLRFFPPFMFANVGEHDFGNYFADRFDFALQARPMAGNYFVSQLLWGRYLPQHADGLPPYLTVEGYAEAQRNAHKLVLVTGSLQESLDPGGNHDGYFLSNIWDWAVPDDRERIGQAVLRSASSEATVFWRHMLSLTPSPAVLTHRLVVDVEASRRALQDERALLYQSVVVARLS